QSRAADDAAAVLRGLGIAQAHLVGLSMGATAAIEFGIRHPHMALSLTAAAAGSGASTDPAAKRRFPEGSAQGHACTMIGVQSRRVPLFEREAELAAIPAPVLIIAGDEDDG